MNIQFDNTYAKLPEGFFQRIQGTNQFHPSLIAFNDLLSADLRLGLESTDAATLARYFSACEWIEGSEPIAMAYAGHQFGHFVPQLGDGRAMLLGEIITPQNERLDLHLKGSGRTFYSRRGDGKSAIGPVLREFLVSEGMFAMGIPTTRSLCAVRTGEMVQRETNLPGAVLTRVAKSHIRVGTFEFFARRGDVENLRILADYTIQRLYPHAELFDFWKQLAEKQILLISNWMSVGFIHGVMNTDNMSVAGETIDYGPCAFMDEFKMNKVFSSIDQAGRYSYSNQPCIALWNLARLAECLLPLMSDAKTMAERFTFELQNLHKTFGTVFLQTMMKKFGCETSKVGDQEFLERWLGLLGEHQIDFTLSWIDLERSLEGKDLFSDKVKDFIPAFLERISLEGQSRETILSRLKKTNPLNIPRNTMIEEAIRASEEGRDQDFFELLKRVRNPYGRRDKLEKFQLAPDPKDRVLKTFCGT